mgnify:CR=1 FL=1
MGRASVQHQEIRVRRRLHPVVRSLPPWRNLLRLRRGDTEELDNFLELPYFVGAETSGTIEAAILGAEKGCDWIKCCLDYYEGRNFIREDGSYDIRMLTGDPERDHTPSKARHKHSPAVAISTI